VSYTILSPTSVFDNSGSGSTVQQCTASMPALQIGDWVAVFVPYVAATDVTQTVTDSLGNTYTENTTPHFWLSTSGNHGARFFICQVTVAGTPTFIKTTAGASCTFLGVFADVIRGLVTSSALQVTAAYKRTAGVGTAADSLASNSATVTTPPVAVLGYAINLVGSNGCTCSAGTGETLLHTGQKSNGLADFIKVEHKRVTGTGAVTSTFTPAQAGDDWVACQLVFTEQNTTPLITSVSTATPRYQGALTINGSLFGSAQGAGSVTLGAVTQTVNSWADTAITINSLLRGTNKYGIELDLIVNTNASGSSNTYTGVTSLLPQTGWNFVNIGTPNSTSANRLTATGGGDIASGDQIAWGNIQGTGTVTVNADGTFSADSGVTAFDYEVWTTTSGWGSTATQSMVAAGAVVQSAGGIAKASIVKAGGVAFASILAIGGISTS